MTAGLSQREVARRANLSQAAVSKAERASPGVSFDALCRIAAAVGYEMSVRLYPLASVSLRDRGQLSMAQEIATIAHPGSRCQLEVPVSPDGLRAADLVIGGPTEVAMIEIVRALVDVQAQLRSGQLKRAALAELRGDGRPVRLIIAVPDTARVRREVRALGSLLSATLSVPSMRIWRALRSGEPIGGDGILFVRERELVARRAGGVERDRHRQDARVRREASRGECPRATRRPPLAQSAPRSSSAESAKAPGQGPRGVAPPRR